MSEPVKEPETKEQRIMRLARERVADGKAVSLSEAKRFIRLTIERDEKLADMLQVPDEIAENKEK